jgi:hypothetical protein
METQDLVKFKIKKFWNEDYINLNYTNEEFNNKSDITKWLSLGFSNKFTGDMCNMKNIQPEWNKEFIKIFHLMGWNNIGTTYYRMMPGTILPNHRDLYLKYINIYNLHGKERSIRRAVIFLEDWKSGHYAEYDRNPFVNWKCGDAVSWKYDMEHMAANMGTTPRYTLQVTGHL